MDPQERARAAKRYAGMKAKAEGEQFEAIIESACDFYRANGIADIEKTPEPMRPIKDLGGGKFIAHYTKAAQADFKGILRGGRAVNFEAKHTGTGRMDWDRVTKDQRDRLDRAHRYGGVAFVLCSFGRAGFFRIPWPVWRDMKERFGHKYITPEEAAPYRVRIGLGGLLFLEGLETR